MERDPNSRINLSDILAHPFLNIFNTELNPETPNPPLKDL